MNSKINKSGFRFSDPKLVSSIFIINKSYKHDLSKIKNITFEVDTQASDIMDAEDNIHQQANVMLILRTSKDIEMDDNTPCYIFASMEASFAWKKGDYKDDTLKVLLKENAPALILSYMRQHIVTITECSEIPTQHVPFLNFTSNKKD